MLAIAGLSASCDENRTLRVTTLDDAGNGSLRSAIDEANRIAAATNQSGTIRIELPAGLYQLTQCGSDDTNQRGDLDLRSALPVTLVAVAQDVAIRQTCSGERLLDALGTGSLRLEGIQLLDGNQRAVDPSESADGGAIRAAADLALENVTLAHNTAIGAPGLAAAAGGTATRGGQARGGAVFVGGTLTIRGSHFQDNHALGGQGERALESNGVPALGGMAEGGAVYAVGAVAVTDATLTDNRALGGNGGGGHDRAAHGGSAHGGAFVQADASKAVNLQRVRLTNNVAESGESGRSDLAESAATGVDAASARGGGAFVTGPLTASEVTATGNQARGGSIVPCGTGCSPSAADGGVFVLKQAAEVSNSTLSNNGSFGGELLTCRWVRGPEYPGDQYCAWFLMQNGYLPPQCLGTKVCDGSMPSYSPGGVIFQESGELTLRGGTIADNQTTGAAIHAGGNMTASDTTITGTIAGGGLAVMAGNASLTRVTLDSNQAGLGVSGELDAQQLRVSRSVGTAISGGRAVLRNSTIDHNGEGVQVDALRAENVTFAYNTGSGVQTPLSATPERIRFVNSTFIGNGRAIDGTLVEIDHSTIVGEAGQLAANELTLHRSLVVGGCGFSGARPGLTVVSASDNWVSDATCQLDPATNRQQNANFALGALANNGGFVQTALPGPGSVLINAIPRARCVVSADARGIPRPQGSGCDIGAVEVVE